MFILAVVIALVAWRAGSLSISGALAAVLTGGLIFGLGGLAWAVLLLTFFISSSVLTKAFSKRKASLAEKFSKGSQRDWEQVLANGGLGALLAVGYAIPPHYAWLWLAFAGAMAAVNADTWSTELGVLSEIPPRLITTGQKVERGTSGGITAGGDIGGIGWGSVDWNRQQCSFSAEPKMVPSPGNHHPGRSGGVAVRFAAGGDCTSDLLVPNMQKRDGAAPATHVWQP